MSATGGVHSSNMNAINRASTAASVVLVGVLAATITARASQSAPPSSAAPPVQSHAPAPGATPPADDKDAATYTRVCSTCHDGQRILSNRRTKDQWGEVIDKMVERGAQGSDEDFTAVLDYLVSHYGRINVNRGTPKDLATVLHVPDKDAEAIVGYRTANGPFTDFDTLAKVPGIDVETLKQNRDAISF